MKDYLLPDHHEFRRYSKSLKASIVNEYRSSGHSMQYLQRKYGIRSASTVYYWIRDAGKDENKAEEPYLAQTKTLHLMSKKPRNESEEIQKLNRRIKELERDLEDSRLLTEAYSLMIKKAEEELKIPIRKKHNTK
jgi:transposase